MLLDRQNKRCSFYIQTFNGCKNFGRGLREWGERGALGGAEAPASPHVTLGQKSVPLYLLFNLVTLHSNSSTGDFSQIRKVISDHLRTIQDFSPINTPETSLTDNFKWRVLVLELGFLPVWPRRHPIERIIYRGKVFTRQEHYDLLTNYARSLAKIWQR